MKSKMVFIQMLLVSVTISAASAVNKGLTIQAAQYIEEYGFIDSSVIFTMSILNFYAIALLVICGLGILGVLMIHINKHRKELAVNIACGAAYKDILRIVIVNWTMKIALIPMTIGFVVVNALIIIFSGNMIPDMRVMIEFDPLFCILSFVITAGFCIIVSLYPALIAARTSAAKILSDS